MARASRGVAQNRARANWFFSRFVVRAAPCCVRLLQGPLLFHDHPKKKSQEKIYCYHLRSPRSCDTKKPGDCNSNHTKSGRLPLAAACLVLVFTMPGALRAQSSALSITLTGQSMIRSDIRAHAPANVPVIESLLKGDVVFTNFETTILDEKKVSRPRTAGFSRPRKRWRP
jgi:hypothetical protein